MKIFNEQHTGFMRKIVFSCFILVILSNLASAQSEWFNVYDDSAKLVSDANALSTQFSADVALIEPKTRFLPRIVQHTTAYLIFYNPKDTSVHLPLWRQVIPQQKEFFYRVAGSEADGIKLFGLMFNGFYLPHELGHGLTIVLGKQSLPPFDNEYLANTIAILWWRKQGRQAELDRCYQMLKNVFPKLKNPVAEGESVAEFFNTNYRKVASDPFIYGYMQFSQFISIYEDKALPDFDTFIRDFSRSR